MAPPQDVAFLAGILDQMLHCKGHPAYIEMLELFLDVKLKTIFGQAYDLLACSQHFKLEQFNLEKYEFTATHKTAYYSAYMPIVLALYYLHLATPKNIEEVRKISMLIGIYFQVEDDCLDVFGDPNITGKVGTDIREEKYTWPLNEALKNCNESQRQVLYRAYGNDGEDHTLELKEIFEQLNIAEASKEFRENLLASIQSAIDAVDESTGLKKEIEEIFTNCLSAVTSDPRKQFSKV